MTSDEFPTDEPMDNSAAFAALSTENPAMSPVPETSVTDHLTEQSNTVEAMLTEPAPAELSGAAMTATEPSDAESPLGIQAASVEVLREEECTVAIEQPDAPPPSAQLGNLTLIPVLEQRIAELQEQEQALKQEIARSEATLSQMREQMAATQTTIGNMVQSGLRELEKRKQELQISVEQLERRQERIRTEMRTTFAGVSQDLAIRVQSFKDYLVGSLQDLALAAEQLDLPKPGRGLEPPTVVTEVQPSKSSNPRFAEQSFQDQTKLIRSLLDQYRNRPDYYGPAWQLRRTFEPVHAERVSNWFFTQGGRGAIRTMGSRLQNILIASAVVSVLWSLYEDRLRVLVLAQSPERLGEWRRGLQDCLGITRSDFGPDRGVALFEDPEVLAQKADRLVKDGLMPLILVDETEDQISLSMLQFPLWLAFAPNPQSPSYSSYGY
ncbi:DUF3086 domain-containing protein [Pantanalinema sp. GBBB05]|uniref:DUF3086 domain-containing protein n=1 Tax=Pantanalinema sp. GBBB05 TaxID=2604139 RepID=UPI001D742FEF|nr:DUF3086 domain-containing protein [Pantanalinema sp. GBBB05]